MKHNAKLTYDQVAQIKIAIRRLENQHALAKLYNVSKQTITSIKNGKNYGYVQIPEHEPVNRLTHSGTIARFKSKIMERGADDCWVFVGSRLPSGYGTFWSTADNKKIYAHRYAYERKHGVILTDGFVCHSCDNPTCCNPAHLFLGTALLNVADMRAKGRDKYSENGRSLAGLAKTQAHRQSLSIANTRRARDPRWAKIIEHDGRAQILTDWAREFGINVDTLGWRLRNGWEMSAALQAPTRKAHD